MNMAIKHLCLVSALLLIMALSFATAHEAQPKKKIKKETKSHHWAAPADERSRTNPIASSSASIQNGKTLFLQNCADCHGTNADGRGIDSEGMDPKPSNLKAMAGHHADGDFAWKIKNGRGDMPGWNEIFSDEQVWDLVNFIQNLKESNHHTEKTN